jgi:uncharacterized protein (DUF1501 family)
MSGTWWNCDGAGGIGGSVAPEDASTTSSDSFVTRRRAVVGLALGNLGWMTAGSALANIAVAPGPRRRQGDVLVVVFLRGGADGLNIVVPHGEDAYHRARPTIGLGRPGSGSVLNLDGFFGFNPALGPLLPLYREGQLAVVHACGSQDRSRSHFEAMATMERGIADQRTGAASGWLARHLDSTELEEDSPLRAVAFGDVMPESLRGATQATVVRSLSDLRLAVPGGASKEAALRSALAGLYAHGRDAVAQAGRETLDVLSALNRMDPARYRPSGGAAYPPSDLGNGLKQVAALIRSEVGLEVACLDKGGWDTHVAEGGTTGWLGLLLGDLARSLAAFSTDVGGEMERVIVLVMSEFGRRVQENSGLGTDHGRGTCMLAMGGGIRGGKVYARWPGLEDAQLEAPGDLRVTTDYRDVLAEILVRRLQNERLSAVFPGYSPRFLGLASSAR